ARAALPLGFQPGRSTDALDFAVVLFFVLGGSRRALVHDGVGRIVRRATVVVVVVVAGAGLAAARATATTAGGVGAAVLVAGVVGLIGVVGILVATLGIGLCVAGVVVVGVVALLTTTTTTSAASSPAAPARGPLPLVVIGIRSAVVAVVILVVIVGVVLDPDRLRRHEQRQVVGPLRVGGGLENQPRLRLVAGRLVARWLVAGRFVAGGLVA